MMANPKATLETTKGTIKMDLFLDEAPITAGNFVDLIKRGFYNGLNQDELNSLYEGIRQLENE